MDVITRIRQALAQHRAARRDERELARQLAHYRSPAERAELDAMIARSDGDTSQVQRILVAQRIQDRNLV